jgi:predicted ester cyclase
MPSSNPSDLKALSRRWFEEVWNQGRTDTIAELLHPDAAIHGLGEPAGDLRGADVFMRFYHGFRGSFSNVHVYVEDVLAEADQAAIRFRFTGTHTGEWLGTAPTGRAISGTGIAICRWRDGQIVEAYNEFDAAGLIAQIS